jgi:hypothetical protein
LECPKTLAEKTSMEAEEQLDWEVVVALLVEVAFLARQQMIVVVVLIAVVKNPLLEMISPQ